MFEYYAKVLKIVDGDTIDVMVDLGMGVHRKERLRFPDNAEVRGELKKRQLQRLDCRTYSVGEKNIIKTEKDKRGSGSRIFWAAMG